MYTTLPCSTDMLPTREVLKTANRQWTISSASIGGVKTDAFIIRSLVISRTVAFKPGPHRQQCRSNIRLCSIRQCCFDIVAGVDRALQFVSEAAAQSATCYTRYTYLLGKLSGLETAIELSRIQGRIQLQSLGAHGEHKLQWMVHTSDADET